MSIQSEAALENGLIDTLQKMNYEYVHIEEEKNLYDNFKRQLEKPLKKVVNTDFYVLTNEEKPTEPRTYRNYYHRLMAHLDIPRLKYHGLRHSFATRCIESNCDYKTVSVLLGHANITTTLNLYVHPNMEQKKKCITKMFKSLGK